MEGYGVPFARQEVTFETYTAYRLEPVLGIKLLPRSDSTVHPEEMKAYARNYEENWKCMEGGILYWVAESREFWNMIINYHSSAATTGRADWDDLFKRLETSNFRKNLNPCMFFARESGCLDPDCPFLHDKETAVKTREVVLEKRRKVMTRPTMRDISTRRDNTRLHGIAMGNSLIEIAEERDITRICSNPLCLKVQWRSGTLHKHANEIDKMMLCTRCRTTNYCSTACQRADWKRHKKEPCLPYDEIVNNDDLWTRFGTRKGTGDIRIQWDEDM